jgi:hypothetical protein
MAAYYLPPFLLVKKNPPNFPNFFRWTVILVGFVGERTQALRTTNKRPGRIARIPQTVSSPPAGERSQELGSAAR